MADRNSAGTIASRAVVAAALWTVLVVGPAAAVSGWTGPTSVRHGIGTDVSMAIGTDGKVYAAEMRAASYWEPRSGDIWFVTNRTGVWTWTAVTHAPATGFDRNPSIALDAANHAYIAFDRVDDRSNMEDASSGVFYVTNAAGSFGSPIRLAPGGSQSGSIKIADGKLYVVYQQLQMSMQLWFETNASGRWVETFIDVGWNASLRLDASNRPRVAYDTDVGLAYAIPSATGFDVTYLRVPDGNLEQRPALALDSRGHPLIAWTKAAGSSQGTYVSQPTADGWTSRRLSSRVDVGGPAVAFDASNHAHVLIGPAPHGIYYFTDASGTWRSTTLSPTLPSWGKVSLRVDGAGHLHALFTAKVGTSYATYYARR